MAGGGAVSPAYHSKGVKNQEKSLKMDKSYGYEPSQSFGKDRTNLHVIGLTYPKISQKVKGRDVPFPSGNTTLSYIQQNKKSLDNENYAQRLFKYNIFYRSATLH